jgi:Transglutaminase-like superfamily
MRCWYGRLRRITASDYRTAIDTLVLAVCVEFALRVMPFSRLLVRLTRASSDTAAAAHDASAAARQYQRLRRFVAVAYEILPFPATCLRQSLVLYGLLERRGVPSRFCVGVTGNGPAFAAHAWIECDGVPQDAAATAVSELRALPAARCL